MKKIAGAALIAVLMTAGSLAAHHSYGDYDREKTVTLEGTVKDLLWANPHVVWTLQTGNQGEYRIEWGAVGQLERQGISGRPLKEGDRLVVIGHINKDPERRIMTLIRAVSRPADGWRWEDPRRSANR